MDRNTLINNLYNTKDCSFDYDALSAPPISYYFAPEDIRELYGIATSVKLAANVDKKYKMIDEIMKRRGFKKFHAGTNRLVYSCYENPTILAKIAVDKVGIKDSQAEFKNQEFLKPFCCKIFEVDSSGVLAIIERVEPITTVDAFESITDSVFLLLTKKIIGKYVLADIGASKYMNYGVRTLNNFGAVILDYPYAYELDIDKTICKKPNPATGKPCGGSIDYDDSFDNLICTRCGRRHTARELGKISVRKENSDLQLFEMEDSKTMTTKAVLRINGEVKVDSSISTKNYVTKDQYKSFHGEKVNMDQEEIYVDKSIHAKGGARRVVERYFKDESLKAMEAAKSRATGARLIGGKKMEAAIKNESRNEARELKGELRNTLNTFKSNNVVRPVSEEFLDPCANGVPEVIWEEKNKLPDAEYVTVSKSVEYGETVVASVKNNTINIEEQTRKRLERLKQLSEEAKQSGSMPSVDDLRNTNSAANTKYREFVPTTAYVDPDEASRYIEEESIRDQLDDETVEESVIDMTADDVEEIISTATDVAEMVDAIVDAVNEEMAETDSEEVSSDIENEELNEEEQVDNTVDGCTQEEIEEASADEVASFEDFIDGLDTVDNDESDGTETY